MSWTVTRSFSFYFGCVDFKHEIFGSSNDSNSMFMALVKDHEVEVFKALSELLALPSGYLQIFGILLVSSLAISIQSGKVLAGHWLHLSSPQAPPHGAKNS